MDHECLLNKHGDLRLLCIVMLDPMIVTALICINKFTAFGLLLLFCPCISAQPSKTNHLFFFMSGTYIGVRLNSSPHEKSYKAIRIKCSQTKRFYTQYLNSKSLIKDKLNLSLYHNLNLLVQSLSYRRSSKSLKYIT